MNEASIDPEHLGRTLFRMTWPMLFGVLSLMSFQLADSAFIARLGVDPLAAQGFTLALQQLIIGVQVGLGIGTTAVISRVLGAGDDAHARRLGGLVVLTGALVIALLCTALWLARRPIALGLGAEPALLPLINAYWIPWLIAAWVGAMLYFGYSLCRAHGNTALPGALMVITSLLNIALDPLFIFVFDWGLPGAAIATIVAFGLGCLVVFPRVLRRHWLTLALRGTEIGADLRRLGGITGPAMLSQLMPPLAAMTATSIVAGFGSAAVGAWGLGTRLEFFSIVVVLALTMSMPPLVGRFLGAGRLDCIEALVRLAVRFVIAWQLAVALTWLLAAGVMARFFSEEPAVALVLEDYLLRVPLSYGGLGVCMLMVSTCNALGQPLRALLISCLRLFLCFLPLLWLGARLAGIEGLLSGALAGNLAAGVVAWLLYRQGIAGLREPRGAAPEPT